MPDEAPTGQLFRASKRRKVIRKPAHTDVEAYQQATNEVITEPAAEAVADGSSGVVLGKKKGGAGKTGINFSTTDTRRVAVPDHDAEQSLVVVGDDGASHITANERFVRPTGRVGPIEDRHMMAYIDSKLAESRPSAHAPLAETDNEPLEAILIPNEDHLDSAKEGTVMNTPPMKPPYPPSATGKTVQPAQERSHKTYQRPTRRQGPPKRKEADVARDSMIEQIMGENQVPHYEYGNDVTGEAQAEDVDHDAAAEDAFKAQLLADLEQSNRRRRTTGKASAVAATGPKLGGSRSQRERMKALEDAKGSVGKK